MKSFVTGLICVFHIEVAYSWGATGHRTVGLIAELHLSSKARKSVKKLLKGESLAEVSTWADEIRSDKRQRFKHLAPWHYVSIPVGKTYEQSKIAAKGDLLTALKRLDLLIRGEIKDPKLSKEEALKLFIHFIGDLHQPLHVGPYNDRGGNDCWVKFHGKSLNLHVLWDSALIQDTRLSFTELAGFIGTVSATEAKAISQGSYKDWAYESRRLAIDLYPEVRDRNTRSMYCKLFMAKVIPDKNLPTLSYEYRYQFLPLLKKQLKRAGIRLAFVLNQVFK